MAIGTIKWFDTKQGFGFIRPDDGANEVFLHISELGKANIKLIDKFALEGLRVGYDVGTNKNNKPAAINIKIVTDRLTS